MTMLSNILSPNGTDPQAGFALLALIQGVLILTITLIAVPLPLIAAEFDLSNAHLVVLQIAYGLPYSGLLLLGGDLTDRLGASRVMRAGLWLFGLTSIGAALAPGYASLVIMRGLQGVAAAMVAPAAMAMVSAIFPRPVDFERAMARWGGISVLGAAIGTVLSGVITTWVSWRWMFLIPACISAIALLSGRQLFLLACSGQQGKPLDILGAGLALLGFSTGGYGLAMGSEDGWGTLSVTVALLMALVSLTAFIWHERCSVAPLLPLDFLATKSRIGGAVGVFLAAASMGLVTFILAIYLQRHLDWSPLATAGAMVPYLAVLVLGGGPAGHIVPAMGPWRSMMFGLLLSAVGLGLLAGFGPGYLLRILPGLLVLPAGTSLIFAASAVLMTQEVKPDRMGLAGGIMNTAMELGPTAGLAGFMSMTALRDNAVGGWSLAFMAAAGIVALAALTTALWLKSATSMGARG